MFNRSKKQREADFVRPYYILPKVEEMVRVVQFEPLPIEMQTLKTGVVVVVPFSESRTGMPTRKEVDLVYAVEETLQKAITNGRVYMAGHVYREGRSTSVFYTNGSVPSSVTVKTGLFQTQTFAVESRHDPEWVLFNEHVYISPVNKHRWRWRKLLEKLKESGDDHSIPRLVDFFSVFPSEESRKRFIEAVTEKGFTYDPAMMHSTEEGVFGVEYYLVTPIVPEVISGITVELQELSESFKGELDGWASPVLKSSDSTPRR